MGFEGFSGNESILYHVESPCRISDAGEFTPIEHEEWIPDAHVHRHLETGGIPVEGDPISGRRCMMWNKDLEVSICRPAEEAEAFYRNGEGDELLFIHRGSGELETIFGTLPYREHDYIVIPHGTTYRFRFDDPDQLMLVLHTPGEVETPNRYRNRYGQLLESAPFSHRDMHPPADLVTHREGGEYEVIARVRGGLQRYTLDYHPLDVVGWDGYVYPYTFNVHDFEPRTGRFHLPPPIHQTFQGPNFVVCSFCPRELDYDPTGDRAPVPPLEPAVRGDHLLRLRRLRLAQGDRGRLGHRAPLGPAARAAARPGREDARRPPHRGAGGDVGHVRPAEADDLRPGPRRAELRLLLA